MLTFREQCILDERSADVIVIKDCKGLVHRLVRQVDYIAARAMVLAVPLADGEKPMRYSLFPSTYLIPSVSIASPMEMEE